MANLVKFMSNKDVSVRNKTKTIVYLKFPAYKFTLLCVVTLSYADNAGLIDNFPSRTSCDMDIS
jgi:hypothetical protein